MPSSLEEVYVDEGNVVEITVADFLYICDHGDGERDGMLIYQSMKDFLFGPYEIGRKTILSVNDVRRVIEEKGVTDLDTEDLHIVIALNGNYPLEWIMPTSAELEDTLGEGNKTPAILQ